MNIPSTIPKKIKTSLDMKFLNDPMREYVRNLVVSLNSMQAELQKIAERPVDPNPAKDVLEELNKKLISSVLTVKGDKGDKGDDGYTPKKGVDYFDGVKGDKGDPGIKGDKGDPGKKGDKGDIGKSPEIDYGTIVATVLSQLPDKTFETVKHTVEKIRKGKEISVKDIKDFPNLAEEIRRYTAHLENNGRTVVTAGGVSAFKALVDVDFSRIPIVGGKFKFNYTGLVAVNNNPTSYTLNTDLYKILHITAQTNALTINTSGTPEDGDTLRISVTGTTAVGLTFGAMFENGAVNLPVATVGTARFDIGLYWNTETNKWRCMSAG